MPPTTAPEQYALIKQRPIRRLQECCFARGDRQL
jgi:hypothetical protein